MSNVLCVALFLAIVFGVTGCDSNEIRLEKQIPPQGPGLHLHASVGMFSEPDSAPTFPANILLDRVDQSLPPLPTGSIPIRFNGSLSQSISAASRLIFDRVTDFSDRPDKSEMDDKGVKVLFVSRIQEFTADVLSTKLGDLKGFKANAKLSLSTLALNTSGDTIATFTTSGHGDAEMSAPHTKEEALRSASELAIKKVADHFMQALQNSNQLKLALAKR